MSLTQVCDYDLGQYLLGIFSLETFSYKFDIGLPSHDHDPFLKVVLFLRTW